MSFTHELSTTPEPFRTACRDVGDTLYNIVALLDERIGKDKWVAADAVALSQMVLKRACPARDAESPTDDDAVPGLFGGELIDAGIPPALAKACLDRHKYALGLRDGTILLFEFATLNPQKTWVHLDNVSVTSHNESPVGLDKDLYYPRGIEVCVSEIAWVADAPERTFGT